MPSGSPPGQSHSPARNDAPLQHRRVVLSSAGRARSYEQRVAPVSLPALQSQRIRRRQDVDRDFAAFDNYLGAGFDPFLAAKLSRRLVVVFTKYSDCQRDLSRQPGLDPFAGAVNADDLSLGEVAAGGQRRAHRSVFYSFCLRRDFE